MYIHQLHKTIGPEIEKTVVTIIYPTSEKRKKKWNRRVAGRASDFLLKTPDSTAQSKTGTAPHTPSLVSVTQDQPRSENSKWKFQK